jgi:hypothetical protein
MHNLPYYCPVGLVRENYGFDDEDPVELARIKFVKEQLAKRKNCF